MRRTIRVFLGEQPVRVGTLLHDAQGARESAAFEYAKEWRSRADGFALAPSLRRIAGPQFHKRARDGSVFHAVFADTEPDGWGKTVIVRDHAKRRQVAKRAGVSSPVRPLDSLDFLLAVDDASRVGGLRFQDESGAFARAHEQGARTTPPLVELGARYLSRRGTSEVQCHR